MTTFTIKDVGPIRSLQIPIEAGTVTVLSGPNGSGKTTALKGLAAAAKGKNAGITPRDGVNAGTIRMPGCTVRVGARVTRRGEPDEPYALIEDGREMARIVDPGVKDPEAADKRRIEALLSIVGVTVQPDEFREFLGDELFVKYERENGATGSIVDAGGDLRRWLQAEARRHEEQVAKADGVIAEIGEVDDVLVPDVDRAYREMVEAEKLADESEIRHTAAQQALQKLDGVELPDIEGLRQDMADANAEVERLTEEIRILQSALSDAKARVSGCQSALSQAEERVRDHEKLTEAVAGDVSEDVVMERRRLAEEARERHRQAVELASMAEKAEQARERLARAKSQREHAEAGAERCRGLAERAYELLRGAIRSVGGGWTVNDGMRLCVSHVRGEETPIGELSHGERAIRAAEVILTHSGSDGDELPVVAIPQEVWESFDADARTQVRGWAKARGVAVVTAEASRTPGQEGIEVHQEVAG